MEKDDTASASVSPQKPFWESPLPVGQWGNYRLEKILGMGGMGVVYKAFDTTLNRYVALKILRVQEEGTVADFLQEARAQASVEHEHVCKIYEVGEEQGRAFITMQFIDGKTLLESAKEMTTEQKVKAVREVCEGLHEAHKRGMIHRDIKPSNIMVERKETGEWIPYVMDFGLARKTDADVERLTVTGTIVGSPWYMSPEQAKGKVRQLDRRSDVYSIGATLYEMVTGALHFEATSAVDVLMKIVHEDPIPARQRQPGIPSDLETIVMKCLEKDPERRYDSARALAEDLRRYLEGEPILAKPATFRYRAAKLARKNKALVGTSAVALLVILIVSVLSLRALWYAEQRAELARQLGAEIKEIENIMRLSYMLPLQDVSDEKKMVLDRIQRISERMGGLGKVGEGPASYAVGRGYLTLKDYDKSLPHLEKAWDSGYREPEVAYALGLVLGARYQKAREDAQRIGNKYLRETKLRELEKSMKDPALSYLKQGQASKVESALYVEGLIAYYQKDYATALEKARQAREQIDWLYEASVLEGNVYADRANEIWWSTSDVASATEDFNRAGEAYRRALAIAESDSSVHNAECRRNYMLVEVQLKAGIPFQDSLQRALQECDASLVADPRNIGAYGVLNRAHWRLAEYQYTHGEDPTAALEKSVSLGNKAVEIDPSSVDAMVNLGNTFLVKVQYEMDRGLDPEKTINAALHNFEKAATLDRNFPILYNSTGIAYEIKGTHELSTGKDPRATLDKSIAAYDWALQLRPEYVSALNNRGIALKRKAEYELLHGIDPRSSLQRAIDSYKKASDVNQTFAYAQNNRALALRTLAQFELEQGREFDTILKEALAAARKGEELQPGDYEPYHVQGLIHALHADALVQSDINPAEALAPARVALAKALKIHDSEYSLFHLGAMLELSELRWQIYQKRNPAGQIVIVRSYVEKAKALNPTDLDVLMTDAEILHVEAQWQIDHKQAAAAKIKAAADALEKALAVHPEYADAIAMRGKLYLLSAKQTASPEDSLKAAEDFQKALKINSHLQRKYSKEIQLVDASLHK